VGRRALLVVLILLGNGACTGSQAAVPLAAHRAHCPEEDVVEIEKSTNVAILDVCGTVEKWRWDPVDGYVYEGPAPDPRVRKPTKPPPKPPASPHARPEASAP
jgi:hypothetical protein